MLDNLKGIELVYSYHACLSLLKLKDFERTYSGCHRIACSIFSINIKIRISPSYSRKKKDAIAFIKGGNGNYRRI